MTAPPTGAPRPRRRLPRRTLATATTARASGGIADEAAAVDAVRAVVDRGARAAIDLVDELLEGET